MNLVLKNWRINPDLPLKEQILARKKAIMDMQKLYHKSTLKDEEFLNILSPIFDWDKSNIIELASEMFGTSEIVPEIKKTDLMEFPSFMTPTYYYYQVEGYTTKKYQRKDRRNANLELTVADFQDLIQDQKYLITNITPENQTHNINKENLGATDLNFYIMNKMMQSKEVKKSLSKLCLANISLNNLGPYQDWLLPLLKNICTSEYVTMSIILAIRETGKAINVYDNFHENRKNALEKALEEANYKKDIVDWVGTSPEMEPVRAKLG